MQDPSRFPREARHPGIDCNGGVDEMYRAGSVGGRSVGGYGYGMMVGNGMPQSSIRCANPRDGNVVLEVVGPLLGGSLLHMSRDAVEREDVDSHSKFSSRLRHFNILI